MPQQTDSQLTTQANVIRNETVKKANTKVRVADMVQNVIDSKINNDKIGAANGVAGLDGSGKVPSAQLPSYVDDVLTYANLAAFPGAGATGIIYIAEDTNLSYRWSGSAYVLITSQVNNASETVAGIVEEATDAQTSAGTSVGETGAKLSVTPLKLKNQKLKSFIVPCSDEVTALTTGTKITFWTTFAMTLLDVRSTLVTAQSAGSIFTVDIKVEGVSILSTKITIDNTENKSTTAVTPPVISNPNLGDDVKVEIVIDQIGNGTAKGLKVAFIGH